MSWLAKRLSLLFFLIAFILILLVTLINQYQLLTILKRILIGGLMYSLLGGVIGQLISYNLNNKQQLKTESKMQAKEKAEQTKAKENNMEDNMEPLDFDNVDETEENIVNMAREAPDQVADMVKNMNQE